MVRRVSLLSGNSRRPCCPSAPSIPPWIVRPDGYWLFTAVRAPHGDGLCLCIFHSSSLTGDWQPHPYNPISMDVCDCRPAGRFLQRDGRLYRLSQDCSTAYGASFSFREVLALSPCEYREQLTATVLPSGI
jgi:hypothetical protein